MSNVMSNHLTNLHKFVPDIDSDSRYQLARVSPLLPLYRQLLGPPIECKPRHHRNRIHCVVLTKVYCCREAGLPEPRLIWYRGPDCGAARQDGAGAVHAQRSRAQTQVRHHNIRHNWCQRNFAIFTIICSRRCLLHGISLFNLTFAKLIIDKVAN